GTGLYISSLVQNIDFEEIGEDSKLRVELYEISKNKGPVYLHHLLSEMDPEAALEIHPNNVKRVVRAIELYMLTGTGKGKRIEKSKESGPEYDFLTIGIETERTILYDRINQRVDKMLDLGLLAEAEFVWKNKDKISRTALQAIGYKEFFSYFEGIAELETCVEVLKKNTRNYAKRQITWLKKIPSIHWIGFCNSFQELLGNSLEVVKNFWEIS
ncbi:MAG: tRNA (adenosine(37)-N6)-dimethylallyltransferase MiaA, partial [Clostridiales bacterium]|nr:tRNA (adenosine(37)-N6)-dimethylallyltransferase MiaA [Clostridiales bacterium]